MRKLLQALLVVLVSLPVFLFGGTTGKIAGVITDADTGEPLPGANVFIQGTMLGSSADVDGYFVILNVPPGRYTVQASMVGYRDVALTEVRVNIDMTTTVNLALGTAVVAGDAVTIVAEREVVQRDVSASTANIEAQQIQALPVQSVEQVVGLQAGVIGLSIRGGGSGETAFMVDGFTLRDERDNTPFTGVSLSAVQDIQIQTGGFNAEYGNIRSGVIQVITREGDPHKYSGTITYQYSPPAAKHVGMSFNDPNSYWLRPYLDPEVAWTGTQNGAWDQNTQNQYPQFVGWNEISEQLLQNNDPDDDLTPAAAQRLFQWQHRRQLDIVDPDLNIDAGFGGPVPFVSSALGNLRFFGSYRGVREMFMVPFSRDAYTEQNFQLKLTSDISNTMKLTVSGIHNTIESVSNNDVGQPGFFRSNSSVADVLTRVGFIDSRLFYDSYWALTDVDRTSISMKLNQTLSNSTFYETKVEYVQSNYDTRPNRERDTRPRFEILPGLFVDEAPFGTEDELASGIDGLLMGVRANALDFSTLSTLTWKFDLSSQVDSRNLVKTGFEIIRNNYDMEFGAVNLILPSGRPWTRWTRSPIRGAFYLQDKLEFKGLIANLGLRLDYIDPRGTWWDVETYDPGFYSTDFNPGDEANFTQVTVDKQLTLSPRLGVAHPITQYSKIYFNYGHFRQIPISDRLYNVRRVTGDQVSVIGDPNLPLEKTVAYELGYEHALFDDYLLRVAGYYKDISDQADLTTFRSANGKVRYNRATNNSYEDIRGVEVTLEKRAGRWLTGFANYTYQVSTSGFFGVGEFFENPSEQREYLRDNPPEQSKPVARPFFRSSIVVRSPKKWGPSAGGAYPLSDWNVSLLGTWREGIYFTWQPVFVPGISNNVQWSDFYDVDLRFSRVFNTRPFNITFFVDISNLFEFKYWDYQSGFVDGQDFDMYMRSLRLPASVTEPLGFTPSNGNGEDSPGDYRPDDVAFEPLEPNPDNDSEIERRNQARIDSKAYIDNPNQGNLMFLNPRDIFMGIKLSIDL